MQSRLVFKAWLARNAADHKFTILHSGRPTFLAKLAGDICVLTVADGQLTGVMRP